MTQEDKELLLKDLSARLHYGVKVTWDGKHPLTVTPHIYCAIVSEDNINNLPKLLLRPMSSMTEDDIIELSKIDEKRIIFSSRHLTYHLDGEVIDYLNRKMFDYRGLIPMGLAIEASEGMYE